MLQNPSQIDGDNINSIRRGTSRGHSGTRRGNVWKKERMSLKQRVRTKMPEDLYRAINFHNTLNRWKKLH